MRRFFSFAQEKLLLIMADFVAGNATKNGIIYARELITITSVISIVAVTISPRHDGEVK